MILEKFSKNLTKLCISHSKYVILVSLLSIGFLINGLKYVHQDDDMVNLLPDNIGSRQVFEEIQDDYGLTEYMFVAVGKNGTSVINKNSLTTIWDITKEFEKITKNGVPLVDEVMSVANLSRISVDPDDDTMIVIEDLINSRKINDKKITDIKSYLDDNLKIKDKILSKNEDYANIILIPLSDEYYPDLAREIHRITDKYKNDNIDFHFGGQAYVTGAVPDMVQDEVKILLFYGLILMIIILLLNLKSIKAVFLILIIIISSMLSMFGFMGWVTFLTGSKNFYFTLMNTSMPIVLLTIANSVGVHILSKFIRNLRKLKDKNLALIETMNNLNLPIFLTSLTTSLAFLTLYFSPISAMIGYGLTIAFGIMWSWLLSNSMLPALISLFNWNLNSKALSKPSYIENLMIKFGSLVENHPYKILFSTLVLVIFSIIGMFYINVEVQYNKMFRKGNIIRDSAEFLDENMTGNVNLILRVTSSQDYEPFKNPQNLNDIDKMQNYLDNFNNVKTTISVNDVVKQLHKVIEGNSNEYYSIPETRQKISNLFTMYEWNEDADISSLLNDDKDQTILTALMSTFSTQKVPLYKQKISKYIEDEIDSDNLKFELTGVMAFIVDFMWLVIKSSAISLALGILVIFITSSFFFKSIKYGAMSIIPVTAAVLLNFGLMGWLGIELTHLTVLLSSIILGVGVDFSIHYISEYRNFKEKTNLKDLSSKTIDSVGYPIILDAWSNMAFGSLLLSSIIPLAQLGGLMVLAMISTSIGALTLLASVLELTKKKIN